MSLPACLTKFDAISAEDLERPKRFYDVIVSRPEVVEYVWSGSSVLQMTFEYIAPFRVFMTREGLDDRISAGYRTTVLREFDEYPE